MYSNRSCQAASRFGYVRRRIRSRLSSWKNLSATALSWQLPRLLMLGSRLCWRKNVCHSVSRFSRYFKGLRKPHGKFENFLKCVLGLRLLSQLNHADRGWRTHLNGWSCRYLDNIFIERLWRSLKQGAIYLEEIHGGFQARRVIKNWIAFYNSDRPHSALDRQTPDDA